MREQSIEIMLFSGIIHIFVHKIHISSYNYNLFFQLTQNVTMMHLEHTVTTKTYGMRTYNNNFMG